MLEEWCRVGCLQKLIDFCKHNRRSVSGPIVGLLGPWAKPVLAFSW